MRVCTAGQMAAIDAETIAGGVSGEKLMERAGHALTGALLDFLAESGDGEHDGHDHAHGSCGHDDCASEEAGNQGPAVNSHERIHKFFFKRLQRVVDEVLAVRMKYADVLLVGEKIMYVADRNQFHLTL